MDHEKFMKEAIKEAKLGIDNSHGGPFGTVIVKDNKIIARGHNCVLRDNDPTEHGEIMAIRSACKKLGTYKLNDCTLYTTAEPCPMCLGAILWSGIKDVYYGCTISDTSQIGFNDSEFYDILAGKYKAFKLKETNRSNCLELFKDYSTKDDRIIY